MSHHILELHPTDVLFFKDGRPMEGSSAGHGAAWPLPHILDSALHHALRRAGFEDFTPHAHTPKRSGREFTSDRGRHFGSLKSGGPFPVHREDGWFFPRPADAHAPGTCQITHQPLERTPNGAASSLDPKYRPVVSIGPPTKDQPEPWLNAAAWQAYLAGEDHGPHARLLKDAEIFAAEHAVGIGIDPGSGTQDGERIYSASYLRLRDEWAIGLIASCMDKGTGGPRAKHDLLEKTFLNSGHPNRILAGGQQRVCTVLRKKTDTLPLPKGRREDFHEHDGKWLVKWVLLTPAIFPHLPANPEKHIPEHPGGWLPTWTDPGTGKVRLLDGPGRNAAKRKRRNLPEGKPIDATLVAALVGKPLPVTGWALTDTDDQSGAVVNTGGARATHLAVPAGSVYHFECANANAARQLANALNWHGAGDTSTIRNRRSTLMGEKGYGLGVCGTWKFHPAT